MKCWRGRRGERMNADSCGGVHASVRAWVWLQTSSMGLFLQGQWEGVVPVAATFLVFLRNFWKGPRNVAACVCGRESHRPRSLCAAECMWEGTQDYTHTYIHTVINGLLTAPKSNTRTKKMMSHISVDTVMTITRKHLCVWERERKGVCVCLCNYSLFNQANDCHATAQKPWGRNETEKNQSTGGRVKREEKVQQNRVEEKSSSEEWRDGWSQWAEGWETNKAVIFALSAWGKNSINLVKFNLQKLKDAPLQGAAWWRMAADFPATHTDKWGGRMAVLWTSWPCYTLLPPSHQLRDFGEATDKPSACSNVKAVWLCIIQVFSLMYQTQSTHVGRSAQGVLGKPTAAHGR